jgi:serralysin
VAKSYVEALLPAPIGGSEYRWNNTGPGESGLGTAVEVTFGFMTDPPPHARGDDAGFLPLTELQQVAARDILGLYQEVSLIAFTERTGGETNDADILFGRNTQNGSAGYAYLPDDGTGGDIWIANRNYNEEVAPGEEGWQTLIHEVGHALGLKHPFEADGSQPTLPRSTDNHLYSVMSYTEAPRSWYRNVTDRGGGSVSWTYEFIYPSTPMLYDIAAIQHLYGVNYDTRSGDTVYTFDPDTPFFECIWDGGGNDTIDISNFSTNCTIDLNDGEFSSIGIPSQPLPDWAREDRQTAARVYDGTNNLSIAYGAKIENAAGGNGKDRLIGNRYDNTLTGNDGKDTLEGGGQKDVLDGGMGADSLVGGGANDTLIGGDGKDTMDGGGGDDALDGGVNKDRLDGGTGDDTLNGGEGSDNLIGGSGDDVIIVEDLGDIASGGDGSDTVQTALNFYVLPDGAERLEVLFAPGRPHVVGTGNDAANTIIGNEEWNSLSGGAGKDTILGGIGNDTLDGGAGNDSLDGGADPDILYGGDGKDRLDGSAGQDQLSGGAGKDVLIWDAVDINVDGGEGTDTLLVLSGDLDLTAVNDVIIVSIEKADLAADAGANALTLAESDVLAMSPGGTLTVAGDASDTVNGGGALVAAVDLLPDDGYTPYVFTGTSTTILVETGINVV